MCKDAFLLVASFADSIVKFRGALIDELLEAGLEVHVAAPGLAESDGVGLALSKKGVQIHGIPMERTGLNPMKDLRLFLALFLLMRRVSPKYFLGYTVKPVVYGSLAAYFAGVKKRFALITGLGYAFTGQASGKRALLRGLIRQLYGMALRCVHGVFFQNPDDEALFRKLFLLSKGTKSSIVNGSGVDLFEYSVSSMPKETSFLLISRLLGDKGVREYAYAAREVKKIYPDIKFELVGWIDGNPDSIGEKEVKDWVDSGILRFRGKLDDVRPAISDCAVYVLPSYREGTPRTVLEAMAMGRAVITTDAPGCRETVVDGENGFIVPVKDIDALEAAMLKMIKSRRLVMEMGRKSRSIAEAKYDVHKVNASMLEKMGIK